MQDTAVYEIELHSVAAFRKPHPFAEPTAFPLQVAEPKPCVTSYVLALQGNPSKPTFVDSTYHDVLLPDTPAEAVPYTFDVDPKTLRNRFLALQSRVHPDGFATASQTERVCAEQQSSFINKGYQALRDPLPRATYLLSLHGLDPKDHDGNDPTATDPALLMDVMEAREALEEAETEEDIKGIKAENEERLNATLRALSDAFRARDIPAARRLTIQLRYWVNIRQAATDWMPGKRVELEH
ncbi:hypothetical protein HKX48_007120 [Thoreauomyces humboldtii]|nr:hypothetical protein HKX48_007120 [Thoreauomyces humboldtii]